MTTIGQLSIESKSQQQSMMTTIGQLSIESKSQQQSMMTTIGQLPVWAFVCSIHGFEWFCASLSRVQKSYLTHWPLGDFNLILGEQFST